MRRPARRLVRVLAAATIAGVLCSNLAATGQTTTGRATTRARVAPDLIATDPYTGLGAQHSSLVEFDTVSSGRRVLATYQVGRFDSGGAANIGWSFSSDLGETWQSGVLPGITQAEGGAFERATDPVAAYDPVRRVWLIQSLGFSTGAAEIVISRSTDGITWSTDIVTEFAGGDDVDKNWIACDTWRQSPHYGNCYGMVRLDRGRGVEILLNTSSDGGLTWSDPVVPTDLVDGFAQIVVRPDGRVVVVYDDTLRSGIRAFVSDDGGQTYGRSRPVSQLPVWGSPSALHRGPVLVSAAVDRRGRIYVLTISCVFRSACTSDDLTLITSQDGRRWDEPRRIPLARRSGPLSALGGGIDADLRTGGRKAAIGIYFYALTDGACTSAECRVRAGFVSSRNGGRTWSRPTWLGQAHSLGWYPETSGGFMIGDYLSTSVVGGRAVSVFGLARAPMDGLLRVGAYTVTGGLPIDGGGRRDPSASRTNATGGRAPLSVGSSTR